MQRVSSMSTFGRGRGARPPGMRVGTLDAQVRAALFGQGQGGYMLSFDQSDALFQDIAGTAKANAGDPIGLILDQRQGLGISAERMNSNLYLSASVANVTAGSDGDFTYSGGTLSINRRSTDAAVLLNNGSIERPGRFFLNFTVVSGTAAVRMAGASAANLAGPTVSIRIDGTGQGPIAIWPQNPNTSLVIKDISIKTAPGNHFQQATATARPLRLQDAQGNWYGRWDGTDDIVASLSPVPWQGFNVITTFAGMYRTGTGNAPKVIVETSSDINQVNGTSGVYSAIDGANVTARSKGGVAIDAKVNGAFDTKEILVAEAYPSYPLVRMQNGDVSTPEITTSQGGGNFLNYQDFIGGRGAASTLYILARYYAIMRVASLQRLTPQQIALGQAWVRSKMGT